MAASLAATRRRAGVGRAAGAESGKLAADVHLLLLERVDCGANVDHRVLKHLHLLDAPSDKLELL